MQTNEERLSDQLARFAAELRQAIRQSEDFRLSAFAYYSGQRGTSDFASTSQP